MDTGLRRNQEITRTVVAAARSQHRQHLRADRRKWAHARSLAEVGELTAQWLEGKVLHQPGYGDPEPGETGPAPETERIAPLLAACCRAGFVTMQSQPGTTDWRTGRPDQRAAVEGFCGMEAVIRLNAMAQAAGLIVVTHDPITRPRRRMRFKRAVVVTLDQGRPFTRFGTRLPRNHLTDPDVGYGECGRDAVREITDAWQVAIIEPEWGRNKRLWPMLERFAGITP